MRGDRFCRDGQLCEAELIHRSPESQLWVESGSQLDPTECSGARWLRLPLSAGGERYWSATRRRGAEDQAFARTSCSLACVILADTLTETIAEMPMRL